MKILVELEDELKKKASQLIGQEMIFQLCQYVQEFLHQHNKPPAKSFYDEMLHRRKVEQERDLQAQQIEQDREVFGWFLFIFISNIMCAFRDNIFLKRFNKDKKY